MHGIPKSHLTTELFIKLREKGWYENTFQADTCPQLGQLTAADLGIPTPVCLMQPQKPGLSCVPRPASQTKVAPEPCNACKSSSERLRAEHLGVPRKPCPIAYPATGVPSNPCPKGCVTCCNSNSPRTVSDERPQWIAAANATADVSDDAIHDLEAAATTELTADKRKGLSSSSMW